MAVAEETMGQRIKAQRIRMGMTQEELADILYLKKSSISRYENDKDEMQAARLGELAKALHTTPDYLLGFEDGRDPIIIEMNSILLTISDERIKQVLLAQVKAVANM